TKPAVSGLHRPRVRTLSIVLRTCRRSLLRHRVPLASSVSTDAGNRFPSLRDDVRRLALLRWQP
ncbi:hypothetical protein B296_00039490, partial [Ensete ventricosum]